MLTGKYFLHSYIYREVEGNKGVNIVVFCLINNFKEMGYFSGPTFGEITIFSDNCVKKTRTRLISDIYYV